MILLLIAVTIMFQPPTYCGPPTQSKGETSQLSRNSRRGSQYSRGASALEDSEGSHASRVSRRGGNSGMDGTVSVGGRSQRLGGVGNSMGGGTGGRFPPIGASELSSIQNQMANMMNNFGGRRSQDPGAASTSADLQTVQQLLKSLPDMMPRMTGGMMPGGAMGGGAMGAMAESQKAIKAAKEAAMRGSLDGVRMPHGYTVEGSPKSYKIRGPGNFQYSSKHNPEGPLVKTEAYSGGDENAHVIGISAVIAFPGLPGAMPPPGSPPASGRDLSVSGSRMTGSHNRSTGNSPSNVSRGFDRGSVISTQRSGSASKGGAASFGGMNESNQNSVSVSQGNRSKGVRSFGGRNEASQNSVSVSKGRGSRKPGSSSNQSGSLPGRSQHSTSARSVSVSRHLKENEGAGHSRS